MDQTRTPATLRPWLAIVAAFLGGAAMASQAFVNGELGSRIHNGFVAATISNTAGIVLVSLIAVAVPEVRAGFATLASSIRAKKVPWFFTLAGALGGFYVTSQGLFVTLVGIASFTVALIAGTSIGSVLIDMWGIGPAGRRAPTPRRLIGAVMGVVAVAIADSGRFDEPTSMWLLIIPFVIGFGVSWQQALNGRVSVAAGNVMTATYLNFLVGTVIMLVFVVIAAPEVGLPAEYPAEWWLYLGGPLGVLFVTLTSLTIRTVGVLVFTLIATLGQLSAALTFDFLFPGRADGLAVVIGVVIMAVAIVIATDRRGLQPTSISRS